MLLRQLDALHLKPTHSSSARLSHKGASLKFHLMRFLAVSQTEARTQIARQHLLLLDRA